MSDRTAMGQAFAYLVLPVVLLVGLVELIVRGVIGLALVVTIVGLLVLDWNRDLLKPISFDIARQMVGLR